jgi:uncharacterized protein
MVASQLIELWSYPLKSGRGNAMVASEIGPLGLEGDRRYMLVTPEGVMLTGREYPRLVLVTVTVDNNGANAEFVAPGMMALVVNVDELATELATTVWSAAVTAHSGHASADAWFSDYLGVACRLCHVGAHSDRRTTLDPDAPVAFADGYPVLLLGSASLADLNQRLAQPLPARQFRTNLLVETTHAFVEDDWKQIKIGEVLFENMKRCERCIFTTIAPDTAEKNPERQPLLTLAGYRRFGGSPCFGINLIPRSAGKIRLADTVEILS